MESNMAIKISNLSKSFADTLIINDCNMNVPHGSIYGFLGANGSGKTTIFKIIIGLLSPTNGTVKIMDMDVKKERKKILKEIGSLIEAPTFYEHLSAIDNLKIHLAYMNTKGFGVFEALDMVGLDGTDKKPVGKFSLGMRQRLGIARAFIHKPQILILDEPINGLDPMGIRDMRNLFIELTRNNGMTILLSSHILSEIEHLADMIGVLVNGTVLLEVSLPKIKKQYDVRLEDYFFHVMSGGNKYAETY
ncbi:ABC transporter ATP-binding protein [Alkalihalobacillus pseudalcaliphilus]|uniref:ABC transporter ATP-binding protein n=1 Tax=Alkalihalobacillus pseudalcaliphilus TaxID=79884 RepID=UPI00064DBE1C|nr:ATP-binding cassette domain-containing protein [Alkalihalobacillus pseudalcaliphilus]KMK74426.1 ABC transporter ATP-binding protein [Alkalihalobacillus pseudalcaliphilus]